MPIGVERFATLCYNLPAPAPIAAPHALKAFRYLDPFKDKKTLASPTPLEILNLVTTGTFNYQRCLSTLPKAEYVVPRQSLADEATAELRKARCLLIHSRLGNGKSIFVYILAFKLAEEGYNCFLCAPDPARVQEDLEILKTFRKVALFFDSYNTAIDVVPQLTELSSDTKFIVAVRTGVQEVRLHEIMAKLPSPMRRISLNGLHEQDREDFKRLLDTSGVRTPTLEGTIDQCTAMREVVVSLYDNPDIKARIEGELAPLLNDQSFKAVFIVSQLLKWIGEDLGAGFLRTVTQRDAYAEIARFREFAIDIFSLDNDELHVRSALFAEYLIQTHFTTIDILDCVFRIIVESATRRTERRYQRVLSTLMRVSNLRQLLRKDANRHYCLMDFFDRLHGAEEVNKEPLFWLQYSILMVDGEDLIAAERFLDTAYARAAASHGFQTYQIDTHALWLYLLIEERENTPTVQRFDRIMEKAELVLAMIGDESHRPHAIRVLQGIEPFAWARASVLSVAERNALVVQCNRLIEQLDRLSSEVLADCDARAVRGSLVRARGRFAM